MINKLKNLEKISNIEIDLLPLTLTMVSFLKYWYDNSLFQ
jgi:hypothetical protein